MSSPFNTGPLAPERNPPINPQYYSPNLAVIESITSLSQEITQVVTTGDNEFVVGQLVRFVIPFGDGMRQLDEQQAYIVSISSSTTFQVGIDTTRMGLFDASVNPRQEPFVIPVGDINSGAINSSGRINNILYIQGSFINVSPQ